MAKEFKKCLSPLCDRMVKNESFWGYKQRYCNNCKTKQNEHKNEDMRGRRLYKSV